MAPVVHGLEGIWSESINFVYLDIDDPQTREFKRALGFSYQPHLFLVDGAGNILQQWVGYTEPAVLEAAFNEAVQ